MFTALAGVVISLYYYFGVIRAIYWSKDTRGFVADYAFRRRPRFPSAICIAGMFWIGLFPNTVLNLATEAAKSLAR